MINSKKLHYLLLAGLIVSMPAQPMGWFDSTWKKVGIGIAAVAALIGILHKIKSHRRATYAHNMQMSIYEATFIATDEAEPLESMIKEYKYNKQRLNGLLFQAAERGKNKTIEMLLKCGANINAQRKGSYFFPYDQRNEFTLETPIFMALLYSSNPTTIKLLLDRGPCIDIVSEYSDRKLDVYDFLSDTPRNSVFMQLLDEHRRKKYNDNKTAIAKEVFDNNLQFPEPLTKMIASYAAEYPLMDRRPLALEQEAAAPHPLSLDAGAV